MKKACLIFSLVLLTGYLVAACSASRNSTPSAIGLVPLTGYASATHGTVKDTVYRVIRNDAELNAIAGASSATAKKPSFTGQMVVALLTETPSMLQFEKAGFVGKSVHIYLRTCTPAPVQPCATDNIFLATIPKVGNARHVQFFLNNEAKTTVEL